MPMKLLRWLVRNRPEIEIIATVIWIVAGEVRQAIKRPRRKRLR